MASPWSGSVLKIKLSLVCFPFLSWDRLHQVPSRGQHLALLILRHIIPVLADLVSAGPGQPLSRPGFTSKFPQAHVSCAYLLKLSGVFVLLGAIKQLSFSEGPTSSWAGPGRDERVPGRGPPKGSHLWC